MLRKQRRFDRKNVIMRDVPGRIDAFENNMQRGRVAFRDIRHAESSARLCPASNAKFESIMLIRFRTLIDVTGRITPSDTSSARRLRARNIPVFRSGGDGSLRTPFKSDDHKPRWMRSGRRYSNSEREKKADFIQFGRCS